MVTMWIEKRPADGRYGEQDFYSGIIDVHGVFTEFNAVTREELIERYHRHYGPDAVVVDEPFGAPWRDVMLAGI